MNFEAYLVSKNIDKNKFQKEDLHLFETWRNLFTHMHPLSFTEQQKFEINKIRRKYLLIPIVK